LTHAETQVNELTARHRRKAGSGPPANALIAWIGVDPHLRRVTASHRRGIAAPLPPHTRATKAAVAACVALAGGGILGITAIVNDGLVAPLASNPSPVLSQDPGPGRAAAPGPATRIQPNPMVFSAPAATQSMVANRQASQPVPTPALNAPSEHIAANGPSSSSRRVVGSSVAAPGRHPITPHRAETLHSDRPVTPIKRSNIDKSDPADTLASSVDAGDSPVPTDPGKSAGSDNPASIDNPAGAGNSTDPSNPAGPTNPSGTASAGDSGQPDGRGKPGAAGGDEGKHRSVATADVNQPSSPPIATSSKKQTSTLGAISAHGQSHTGSTGGQGSP
jgi:hypothetical protein